MKTRSITQIALALMLIVIVAGISVGYAAPNTQPGITERHGEHGEWKYRAGRNQTDGHITASVTAPLETATQIHQYVDTQRELAIELIGNGTSALDVDIVFRQPLSQPQFEHFVTAMGMRQVTDYTLRYLDRKGQRVTINGAPENGVLVPENALNMALTDLQERAPGRLLGWVQVHATITSKSYQSILQNRSVYLVDVSRSVIRAAFNDEIGVASTTDATVELIAPQLYWKLEDVRLVTQ